MSSVSPMRISPRSSRRPLRCVSGNGVARLPDALHPAAVAENGEAGYSVDLKHKIEAALAGEFQAGLAQSYFLGDWCAEGRTDLHGDRKSTRLNSSHPSISYAVFCLQKKQIK